MKSFNHAYTVAFEVRGSSCPDGEDVTADKLQAALTDRIKNLMDSGEMLQAVGAPYDTYEEDKREPFTVIAFVEDTGQIVAHHVVADDASNAFQLAAEIDPTITFVAALPGHQREDKELFFPGEGLVDAETVLDQPEVFGKKQ